MRHSSFPRHFFSTLKFSCKFVVVYVLVWVFFIVLTIFCFMSVLVVVATSRKCPNTWASTLNSINLIDSWFLTCSTCCCCSSIFFNNACCCRSPWSSSSLIDADSLYIKSVVLKLLICITI